MERLLIDELNIRCEDLGTGPVTLFLHGFGGGVESFLGAARDWPGRRILFDLPGFSQSDPPPKAFSAEDYAAFAAKLLDQKGIGRCAVVAHSFGARAAMVLAAATDRVEKLILTGAAGLKPRRGPRYYARVWGYKLGKKLSGAGLLPGFEKREHGSADYRGLCPVMKQTFVKVVNQNLRPYLKHISAPTLLVWGKKDRETPLWMARILEREIPDCGLVVFEDCGHFSYLERQREFVTISTCFLREEG